MKKILLTAFIALSLVSCKEETEQSLPDKKGSREVILTCIQGQDSTTHFTTQKIYLGGKLIKTETSSFKTVNLPAANDTIEDENGEEKVVKHSEKFPIFITVQ